MRVSAAHVPPAGGAFLSSADRQYKQGRRNFANHNLIRTYLTVLEIHLSSLNP
jgi:hypothetical protein